MGAGGGVRSALDLVAPLAAEPPAAPAAPAAALAPGTVWAGWTVEALVGHGGMGQVYRARGAGAVCALKIMAADGLADPQARARFANEARLAALVDSPHVVRVVDSGVADGHPWLAMELVEGRSLAEDLRAAARPPPPPTAAGFALQAARGLAAAHACGLVHRDIKPANLLLDGDDALKIADFGLARLAGASTLTRTGTVLGTPQYISPEQGRGEEADHRGDLYSLGCVLYELLTLRPPFTSASVEALIFQHNYAEPPLPTALNRDVPADLQAVCLKCLQKDPARRYPDAAALAEDLERVVAGLAPRSAVFAPGRLGTGADEALRRKAGWGRLRWPLAAVLASAAAAGLGWWWWDARKAEIAQVRDRLAPLSQPAAIPATAAGDLARLAVLSGDQDPQVRQGRQRLAEAERLRAALDPLAARCEEPAARAEGGVLAARLGELTGGSDPAVRRWLDRLQEVQSEIAGLRAALGGIDAGPLGGAERRAQQPRLDRLAALAGDADAEVQRWRAALAAAAAEQEALLRRCGRLDDPAPLTAAALDDLAACHRRLAGLDPAAALPAGWAARLERERTRLADLQARLAAALAADPADQRATAEAEAAARALGEHEALDPADAGRLERRRQAEQARRAAALAEREALAGRCAVLDAPRSLPAGLDADLAAYERLAGLDDERARRWRTRLAEVRLGEQRCAALDRDQPPAAEAAADLARLAALVGADDPAVRRWQARLAEGLAAVEELRRLQRPAPWSAEDERRLAAVAARLGGALPEVRAAAARLADARRLAGELERWDALWVLGAEAAERARAALAAFRAAAGEQDGRWARAAARLAALLPPPPRWAAAHGHDRFGPWAELEVEGVRQRLRWLPPGTGLVGSPPDEAGRDGDEAAVRVRLSAGLWLADGECGQELYAAVTGQRPARRRGPGLPVEQVSAAEAEDFCARLGARLGAAVRLPGEAEWELAMRAGSAQPWGALDPAQVAGAVVHAGAAGPAPAQEGAANPLGLRHGAGNLWEWCRGAYAPPPAGDLVEDPAPAAGPRRVARGGSWADPLPACRLANRAALDPAVRSPCVGFRFGVEP